MGPKTKSAIKFLMFFPALFAGMFVGPLLGLNLGSSLGLGMVLYWIFQTLVWPRVWQGEVVSPEQWRRNRIGSFAWVCFLFVAFTFFGWLFQRDLKQQQAKVSEAPAVSERTLMVSSTRSVRPSNHEGPGSQLYLSETR